MKGISLLASPAQWKVGDGIGGSEERIGSFANKEICYQKCLNRRKNGKLANGVTVDSKTQKSCFCEYGMKGRNRNGGWVSTFINRGKPPAPVRMTGMKLNTSSIPPNVPRGVQNWKAPAISIYL